MSRDIKTDMLATLEWENPGDLRREIIYILACQGLGRAHQQGLSIGYLTVGSSVVSRKEKCPVSNASGGFMK